MITFPLGKVAVAVAGTPVLLSSLLPTGFPANHKCHAIRVSQVAGVAGKVYFGSAGISALGIAQVLASTGAGVIHEFLPPTATGYKDYYEHGCEPGNQLNADHYAFDVATGGDSVFVSIDVV